MGRRPYRLRKTDIKSAFGKIKHARRFRQFLPRSLGKVRLGYSDGR